MEKTNNKPIRVLQINANSKHYGGVSSMIYEIYKNIDRKKFQFDFVSPIKTTYELKRKEIEDMGGTIIELNTKGNAIVRKIQIYKRLKKLIKERKYDIAHINSGSFFFNLEIAMIAKWTKINKRIVHSHNGINPKQKMKNKIIRICKPLLNLYATDFLTCSNEASQNMFTNKLIKSNRIIMIKNGIETDKFKFNQNKRDEYRKQLNIENKIVLGNIGRFMEQKNHKFLLEVFKELLKLNNNFVLLLIGDGELKQDIENYAKELQIDSNIKFLGLRNDIPELLSCMDLFIMTSIHEGLPVVGIEAQASGLPMILSDCITKEVKLSDNVNYISLDKSAYDWASEINIISQKEISRQNAYNNVKEQGFDIKQTVNKIQEIYLS